MVTVSDDLFEALDTIAGKDKKSLSKVAVALLERGLESLENEVLNDMVKHRTQKDGGNYATLDEVWPFSHENNKAIKNDHISEDYVSTAPTPTSQ